LKDLTWIGDVDESAFNERYDWLSTKGKDWYYCIVIDDGEKIVATATMITERKL
jgi:glucosamine-phosphate N-acetyltransferase